MKENLLMMKCVEHLDVLIRMIQVSKKENGRSFLILICILLGFITINELGQVLRRLYQNISEKRIMDILNLIDIDHDGKISYDEFVYMLEEL